MANYKQHNEIVDLTFDFSLRIIELYRFLIAQKEFVMSNQLLKSGTSIGANVAEAQAAQTKADFIRLRRKPRAPPVDECVKNRPKMKYCCYGGCRQLWIILRSLGVGGYFMEVPRALPVGLHY